MQQASVPFSFFPIRNDHLDGTYSIFNQLTNKSYELNPSAAYLAWMCDGTRNKDEIIQQLGAQFSIGKDDAEKAVTELFPYLEEKRLLVWRKSKIETVQAPSPKFVILEVTNRCNLNCIHCSVCANERSCQELSTQEWATLIKDLSCMGTQAIGLSGGEPLLRKDIFDIASFARDSGLQVGLVTNGLLLSEKVITKIKSLGLSVQVSLDGSNQDIHNKIRGSPKCFEKLINKLGLLQKHGVDFTIAAVATAQNYKNLPELLSLSEKTGASSLRVQPFFPVGRGSRHRNELDLNPAMTKEVTRFLKVAGNKTRMQVGGFYFQFLLEQGPTKGNASCEDAACSGGYDFAGITPEGFVYPCSHIWQLAVDNIREQPFAWIWRNSRLLNFFRSLKREDVNSFCQQCKFFGQCRGGCRAMNLINGHIFAPDSHCWLAHPTEDSSPRKMASKSVFSSLLRPKP